MQKKSIDVYIAIGLLVLLVIVVIFALLYRGTTINQTQNEQANTASYPLDTSALIPVTPPNNIVIKDNNVVLTNDWLVTDVILDKTFDNLQCKDLTDKCLFYKVTKGDVSFYVSNQELIPAINTDSEDYNLESLSLETSNGTRDFNHYSSLTYIPDGVTTTDENGYMNVIAVRTETQISGCITDNFCVSTTILPTNAEDNKANVEVFKNLLISFAINTK